MSPGRRAEDLKALAHPVRIQILLCLQEGLESPVEIFTHLANHPDFPDLSFASLSYNVRKLEDLGHIRLKRTERVRGAVKHIYALTAKGRHLVTVIEEL